MSTKIDTQGLQGAAPAASRPVSVGPAASSSGRPAAPVAASDSVRLTADAQRLQQLEQTAAETPAVDLKRVAEIRERLRDGSYEIRPEVIAARLLRMEWEIGGS